MATVMTLVVRQPARILIDFFIGIKRAASLTEPLCGPLGWHTALIFYVGLALLPVD
jgi:hypothetical protein